MIRFLLLSILILLIARAFWRVFDGLLDAAGGRSSRGRRSASPVRLVRDPVCGTYVTPATAHSLALGSGKGTAYFCSTRCRDEFSTTGGAGVRTQAS